MEQRGRCIADRYHRTREVRAPQLDRGGAAGGLTAGRERRDRRVAQRADHRVLRGQPLAADAGGDHLAVDEDCRALRQCPPPGGDGAARPGEIVEDRNIARGMGEPHRQRPQRRREAREAGFRPDQRERPAVDRRRIAQVGVCGLLLASCQGSDRDCLVAPLLAMTAPFCHFCVIASEAKQSRDNNRRRGRGGGFGRAPRRRHSQGPGFLCKDVRTLGVAEVGVADEPRRQFAGAIGIREEARDVPDLRLVVGRAVVGPDRVPPPRRPDLGEDDLRVGGKAEPGLERPDPRAVGPTRIAAQSPARPGCRSGFGCPPTRYRRASSTAAPRPSTRRSAGAPSAAHRWCGRGDGAGRETRRIFSAGHPQNGNRVPEIR